jgi:hypothetical protein
VSLARSESNRDEMIRAGGARALDALVALVNALRWALYGLLALLEPFVMYGLALIAIGLVLMCSFYALVRPAHFPFLLFLSMTAACGFLAIAYFSIAALILPHSRR